MKIGRNTPCLCGSGKKYKHCCLNKNLEPSLKINPSYLESMSSDFDYIQPIAKKLSYIMQKYVFHDVITAVYCINLWRKNRSALAQNLSLNMALTLANSTGTTPINSYSDFQLFYSEIANFLKISSSEDYITDDYGEVFINHCGKSYPVIIGTGHQQVYAVLRYMQTLSSICNKNDELTTLLEYINTIITHTHESNIPNAEFIITHELPSEDFWNVIKNLFSNPIFRKQFKDVSEIMGYEKSPIEMRHFVNKGTSLFPLFNASLLIDYYKLLLSTTTEEEKDAHITKTILSILENSFNFSSNSPHRVLLNPMVIDSQTNKPVLTNKLFFASFNKDCILIGINKNQILDRNQLEDIKKQIGLFNNSSGLYLAEKYYRKELKGGYSIKLSPHQDIVYMVINPFTDVTEHNMFFEEHTQEFECTALDALYLLGFSNGLNETIDYIQYNKTDSLSQLFSFGGKSNHFFVWKTHDRQISSGAIEYDHMIADYNATEDYVYSYFKDYLMDFPKNNYALFLDPLNWIAETSNLNYVRIFHKGCLGFGGEIKKLADHFYLFISNNVELFIDGGLSQEMEITLKTIDELNQRLFVRYAKLVSELPVLNNKTLQLLFMPWNYANTQFSEKTLSNPSIKMAYSEALLNNDSVMIRYTVRNQQFLDAIQNTPNRGAENQFLLELLKPLEKYSPKEFALLKQTVITDSSLPKTVGVFTIEQDYYFSDQALDTDLSSISFVQVKKEIAKICLVSDIEPGEYTGRAATSIIRKMQITIVQLFESYLSNYDQFDLHQKALNYYAVQQNGIILNMKRYASFKNLDPEIQIEFEQETIKKRENYRRNISTAEYLLESNLIISHIEEPKKCSPKEFEFLLAFADWLVVLQDNADLCYYTNHDITISIDEEYKLDTNITETAQKQINNIVARKYSTKDYQIKNDSIDHAFAKEAMSAFYQDTNLDFSLLISLIEYMQLGITQDETAKEIYPNVFEIEKDLLLQKYNALLESPEPDINVIANIINFLTINPSTLKTVEGNVNDILPIWKRKTRNNRFNVKPIIMHNGKCIFSPVIMNQLLTAWKSGILEWYLPYETGLDNLNAVLKKWKKRYEDQMVQDIAEIFRTANFDIVIPEVDLVHRFPKENYPEELGDYDVLAINTSKKEIWIIESKVLQKVGSVYEDQMQQKSFFFQHKDDEKFQRRIDYMTRNYSKVLTSFEVNNETYTVIPYMVTNKLFSSRYKQIAFPIITFDELHQLFN